MRRADDSTAWIGYADFLTTIAILFFIALAVREAKAREARPGYIAGTVTTTGGTGLGQIACDVAAGDDTTRSQAVDGRFVIAIDNLLGSAEVGLAVVCEGFDEYRKFVAVRGGDTTNVAIEIGKDETVGVERVPGDALFALNEFRLRPEGVDTVVTIGRRIAAQLSADQIVVVQGHTDDVPFPLGASKDNWILSGERAAAAAKLLVDSAGIPECQVAFMGFGPSQPISRIEAQDNPEQRQAKRAKNRRIEFRRLQGASMVGEHCG